MLTRKKMLIFVSISTNFMYLLDTVSVLLCNCCLLSRNKCLIKNYHPYPPPSPLIHLIYFEMQVGQLFWRASYNPSVWTKTTHKANRLVWFWFVFVNISHHLLILLFECWGFRSMWLNLLSPTTNERWNVVNQLFGIVLPTLVFGVVGIVRYSAVLSACIVRY